MQQEPANQRHRLVREEKKRENNVCSELTGVWTELVSSSELFRLFFFVHFLYSFYWILCFEESDKNLVSLVSGKIVFQSVTTLILCCFKLNVQLNLPIP